MSEPSERRGQQYSIGELTLLRESPLVCKPDGLPSIAQWMDPPMEQNNLNGRRKSGIRDGDPPQIGDNRPDRPLLINSGMGHFGRRPSAQTEETLVLRPPKLPFPSASRNAKATEALEKRTVTSPEDDGTLADRFPARDRWTRDRDGDRNRDRPSFANGRRTTREDGEGWTNVRSRKSLGQDDFDRGGRNGDRERERNQKDGDDVNEGNQRRTMTREKFDARWGRREEAAGKESDGTKFGSGAQTWRDREKDRDWTRGAGRIEEDPEWMDTPMVQEKGQARTQEDFQRWKENFSKSNKKDVVPEEKEEPVTTAQAASTLPPPEIGSQATSKPATPMATLDGGLDKLFGTWGKEKSLDVSTSEASSSKAKPKAKPSRFAGLFAPVEEPLKQTPMDVPAPLSNAQGNETTDDDKEGFQRILKILSSSSKQPPQPGVATPTNGTRNGGIPLGFTSPPPEHSPEAQLARQPVPRAVEERNILEQMIAPRPSVPEARPTQPMFNPMSPEPEVGFEQFRVPRTESNRPMDDYPIQQPPSRNSSAQGALNLQNSLTSRTNADLGNRANLDRDPKQREREFLLALMQPSSRHTPPQLGNQNLPRPPPESQNLPPFFDMNAQKHQAQSKARGLPPGLGEDPRMDPRMFAENEMMRREAERREASFREAAMRDAAIQKANARLPPGIFPDDPAIASLQRRNTAGEIPRQMTNMGIPSQPISDIPPYMRNPGVPQPPQERNIAPPPGFAPGGMRQPPGFGGPQQPMVPMSAGNTPYGHPAMGPPRPMGGMFPNTAQSPLGPPGPPQGYFPPPGFPPHMGMGNREDPRMMMGRPEFDQFGVGPNQPGMNRPGVRPPNMYNNSNM